MSTDTFNVLLKAVGRKVLPAGVWQAVRYVVSSGSSWRARLHLARLHLKCTAMTPDVTVRCLDYEVRINDGPNFYILYKDIFVHRIYHFEAQKPDPFILDCGGNIGMAVLYFKHIYPQARIISFEPDSAIFPYLQENVTRNGLANVELVQAAIAGRAGTLTFYSDGKYGSCLAEHLPVDNTQGWKKHEVPCVRLWDYLAEPVDFLKMNIEGAEWEALADSENNLRQVREMVIEYHHLPGLPRSLHKILELLHRQRFEYLIYDFDFETNSGVRPPFRLTPDSRYFLLIYAKRMD